MSIHSQLTGASAIHPIWFAQSGDPGAVGAGKLWLDTTIGANIETGAILKERNGANSAWTTRIDISGLIDTDDTLIDALGDLVYGSADNVFAKLSGNITATKKFLTQTGTGSVSSAPGWNTIGTTDIPAHAVVGTESAGDNSTKAASTAYADNAVAKQPETLMIAISDETTALTTGTAKVTFRMPFACSMTAIPRANVNTVSSSGLPTFDIKKNGTTIFSTPLTIDASEKTSVTAATPAVLTSSPTTFADDDEITIDISTAGTGTKGAKITLNVVRT
jgi:hypothetical protein